MDSGSKISRRAFMRLVMLAAGGLSLIAGCAPKRPPGRRVLSDDDAGLLGAIADRIIPPDAWPGGRENGVVAFIDRQLDGPYRRFRGEYRRGLDAVTESCLGKYRKRFELLSAEEQNTLLGEMESGSLRDGGWKEGFSKRFFELVRSHAMQAYYGSPRHGGNPDYASYRMMGIDYPPVIGQNRYRP
jgi:gluconate 2-dehydrogenase gamma chain